MSEAPKEKADEIAAVVAANHEGLGVEDDDGDIPMTFPQRLMQVVSDESNSDTIAWLPHGKGFIIYKKKKFASDVLPKAFKHSKYTSFTRKLNRWGFTRVTRGPETGAYYHKFFQRGDPRLCMQMSCQSNKSNPNKQQGGYPADVQNQQLIRQQLQQLQMHQFHLQQMQQMQAAEMFRQQQAQQQANNAKSEGGDVDKDSKDGAKSNGDSKPAEGAAAAPQVMSMTADNPYLQSLHQAAPQMGFVPMLAPGTVFPGGMAPPGAMAMPAMAGVMPPQQQAAPIAAAPEESKVEGATAEENIAAAASSTTAI